MLFKELYYWLYELLKKVKTNDNPGFNAYLGISFFECVNVLALVGIVNYFFALDIPRNIAVYFGIFIYVSLTAINFFSLFRKRNEIIKKLEKYSTERQNKGKLYFWLYALTTIVLFIYVIINLVKPKY
jgi:hypothetical protein